MNKWILNLVAFTLVGALPAQAIVDEIEDDGSWILDSGSWFQNDSGLIAQTGTYFWKYGVNSDWKNRSLYKDFGITLEAGKIYQISVKLGNQADAAFVPVHLPLNPFDDRLSFGFFDAATSISNTTADLRNAIQALGMNNDISFSGFVAEIPTNGEWVIWSYDLSVMEGASLEGTRVYFGLASNSGNTPAENRGIAVDDLSINIMDTSSVITPCVSSSDGQVIGGGSFNSTGSSGLEPLSGEMASITINNMSTDRQGGYVVTNVAEFISSAAGVYTLQVYVGNNGRVEFDYSEDARIGFVMSGADISNADALTTSIDLFLNDPDVAISGGSAPTPVTPAEDSWELYTYTFTVTDSGGDVFGSDLQFAVRWDITAGGNFSVDNVIPEPDPVELFSHWISNYGLAGADLDADADPDCDGCTNYQEWFAGTNPAMADEDIRAISLPRVPVDGDSVNFSIRRLSNAGDSNIVYQVYASTNLLDWIPVYPETVITSPIDDSPGYELVNFQMDSPVPGTDRLFLLVRYILFEQASGEYTSTGTAQIYPFDEFGSTVEYVGYDIKQKNKAAALTAPLASKLFGTEQDNMNLLRVPIYGHDGHPVAGDVDSDVYADIVEAMGVAKAARSDIKFFASLKIDSTIPWYPSWVLNTDGSFIPESYAILLADYLTYMNAQDLPIDFLGITNEPENRGGTNYTSSSQVECIDALRAFSTNEVFDFSMPVIIGPCSINPEYGTDAEGNEHAAEVLKNLGEAGRGDVIDIASTHYDHDWRDLEYLEMFNSEADSLGKDKWQSEVHWNNEVNLIDDAEHAFGALWDCTDTGFNGFVYWAYSRSDSGTGNKGRIFQQINQTLTYCRPVGIDDHDGSSLEPGYGYFISRAFRMENSGRIHIWVVNNSAVSYPQFRFDIANAQLFGSVNIKMWNVDTQTDSSVGQAGDSCFYADIPASNIVQCIFDIQ